MEEYREITNSQKSGNLAHAQRSCHQALFSAPKLLQSLGTRLTHVLYVCLLLPLAVYMHDVPMYMGVCFLVHVWLLYVS